jgi:serine/threonine-protein kinase RsbW
MRLHREPRRLRFVRGVLDTVLAALRVAQSCRAHILVATVEACTNAVQHAGDAPWYELVVDVRDGWCAVSVVDRGPGFQPPAQPRLPAPGIARGRGLYLIAALADQWQVVSEAGRGTTVTFTKALTWAASPV